MILTQETVKNNYLKRNKIVRTYERTTITVETEADMQKVMKNYLDSGWKLGFYDNKELKLGFEFNFETENYKNISQPQSNSITRERFYTLWNALLKIANELTYSKDMVDEAKRAIKAVSEA